MSNHMISRVFLQTGRSFNHFIISSLDYVTDNGTPSLEQQVRMSMKNQSDLALRVEEIDSHWLVMHEGRVVRVADSKPDLVGKCRDYAIEEAGRRARNYSAAGPEAGKSYLFIDVAEGADIRKARELSGEIPYHQ